MRYVLKIELIGDNHVEHRRLIQQGKIKRFGRKEIESIKLGNQRLVSWVAEIRVPPSGRVVRNFIRGEREYRETNTMGSRGIYHFWVLRPGIYEVNERTGWTTARRYYLKVIDDATTVEIDREEAMECAKFY